MVIGAARRSVDYVARITIQHGRDLDGPRLVHRGTPVAFIAIVTREVEYGQKAHVNTIATMVAVIICGPFYSVHVLVNIIDRCLMMTIILVGFRGIKDKINLINDFYIRFTTYCCWCY